MHIFQSFFKIFLKRPVIRENGPITIELRGVECMNDDPSEVVVLYIKVHEEKGCLQKICNEIAKKFLDAGEHFFKTFTLEFANI